MSYDDDVPMLPSGTVGSDEGEDVNHYDFGIMTMMVEDSSDILMMMMMIVVEHHAVPSEEGTVDDDLSLNQTYKCP